MTAGKIKFKASKSEEFHNLKKDRQLLGNKMKRSAQCRTIQSVTSEKELLNTLATFNFRKKKMISLKKIQNKQAKKPEPGRIFPSLSFIILKGEEESRYLIVRLFSHLFSN